MAIEYKAIPRRIMLGSDKGQTKYFASANNTGNITTEDLAQDIEQASTVNGEDIRAVLSALHKMIPKYLKDGHVVGLEGIGSFRMTLASEGQDTEEQLSAQSIHSARVVFKPYKSLRDTLEELEYKKV